MNKTLTILIPLATAIFAVVALANPARDAIVAKLAAEAKAADPAFAGFSAERGRAFFLAKQTGGSAATPSCTSCHGATPQDIGKTRANLAIAPMAVSKTPDRYTDADKVAQWFDRNCKGVLGRVCTQLEKGDFITFMAGQ
ncbi:MAG: DUF1924 domain-containing protein [Candidatus Binatia bacterium]